MFRVFYQYRALAFNQQISLLSHQIKQLLGMLFVVLYSASPGVILLIFLALGKIIKSDGGSVNQVGIAWCFLVVQTVFFYALRHAILNTEQRYFQLSIAKSRWWIWLVDCRNLMFTHVFLWCSLFLLGTMNSSQLSQNMHFIVFTALQLLLGILSLYRMQQTVMFCLCSAVLVAVFPNLSPFSMLLGWFILLLGCCFVPSINWQTTLSVKNMKGFWLSFYSHHYQVLLWRLACGVVIVTSMLVLERERPDLNYYSAYFSYFTLLLLVATLHIEVAKITAQFGAFFYSVNKLDSFNITRILNSTLLYFLLLALTFLLFNQWCLAAGVSIVAVVCFYVAEKKPERLALVWGCFLVGGLFI